MELRYRREAAVGLLIVVGAAVFVFLMMWLRGRSFRQGEMVDVTFDDVAGLKVGDPVRTSGVTVGSVKSIELRGPGNVRVSFDVRHGPPPRVDAGAQIKSADLFGARIIEYTPGVATAPLPDDSVIRGTRLQDVSEMAVGMSAQARVLLDNSVQATRELRAAMVEARALLGTLNAGASANSRELQGALENLRMVLHRMDLMVADNAPNARTAVTNMREASANLDRLTRNLASTTATLDTLATRIASGRGAIGQLMNDTSLVNELRATNRAMQELLVDLKANPGRYIRLRF